MVNIFESEGEKEIVLYCPRKSNSIPFLSVVPTHQSTVNRQHSKTFSPTLIRYHFLGKFQTQQPKTL